MVDSGAAEPYILFEVAAATYAVRSSDVRQLDMIESITPLPNAPAFVDGVVFSRGQVIPAVNLRARFGFPRIPLDTRARLLVVTAGGRTVGLITDTAREFVTIPAEAVRPPPEAVAGLSGDYLEGIANLGDRLILVLDVRTVLDSGDVAVPEPITP
ncbi:MAG TPA: chemotaxis protein CheW [Chloroflexia bacterium]|nr:chemotaxis protein CheW [Chloroflexia bacterium]